MKRLIVVVVMLVVGMMLVGSAEAFCIYNKTGDKILANVKLTKYVSVKQVPQSAIFQMTVQKNDKSCENESATFNPTEIYVNVIESAKSVCSITMDSPKDIEVTKENNKYFCSEKK